MLERFIFSQSTIFMYKFILLTSWKSRKEILLLLIFPFCPKEGEQSPYLATSHKTMEDILGGF